MTVNVGFFFFLSFFEYWRSSLFGIWFIVVQRFCSMNHRPNFNSLRTTITWELPTRNRKKGSLCGHLIYFLSTVPSVFVCPIALRYRIHQPFYLPLNLHLYFPKWLSLFCTSLSPAQHTHALSQFICQSVQGKGHWVWILFTWGSDGVLPSGLPEQEEVVARLYISHKDTH